MSSIWGQSSVIYCFSGAKRKQTIENDDTVIDKSTMLIEQEKSSQSKAVQNITFDKSKGPCQKIWRFYERNMFLRGVGGGQE